MRRTYKDTQYMEQTDLLIIKNLSGATTPEEQSQLLSWLERHPDNQHYFRSLKDAYDLGQFEQLLKESRVNEQWADMRQRMSPARKPIRLRKIFREFIRYAAVLLLGILFYPTAVYLIKPQEQIQQTCIETGVGERAQITLPDGSRVWINSCSMLTYDSQFGKDNRPVNIKGEAYFEVHSDIEKPFLVHNGAFTYRVTGTSFNVSAFDNEQETSIALLEGGVTIEFGKQAERLHPGEKFTFNKNTGKYRREQINVNRLTSWRTGEITFNNISFEELTRKLERSFNVTFIFQNEKLKNETFSGSFHNYDPMETILEVLKISTPQTELQCTMVNDTIYIK